MAAAAWCTAAYAEATSFEGVSAVADASALAVGVDVVVLAAVVVVVADHSDFAVPAAP